MNSWETVQEHIEEVNEALENARNEVLATPETRESGLTDDLKQVQEEMKDITIKAYREGSDNEECDNQ